MARNSIIRSGNNDQYARVPRQPTKRNLFHRPHSHISTGKMGWLMPLLVEETMPTDTWYLKHQILLRFLPLYFPIMHRIEVTMDYFYVPNRILWPQTLNDKGWIDFIQDQDNLIWPYMDLSAGAQSGAITTISEDSTLCYMGIPTTGVTSVSDPQHITAMKVAAYAMIWDYYYRADPVQDEIWQPLNAGQNNWCNDIGFALPLKANNRHDYFNSALPQPVAGEDILVPNLEPGNSPYTTPLWLKTANDNVPDAGAVQLSAGGALRDANNKDIYPDPNTWNENAATIRRLRLHEMWQAFFEKANRLGTKYRDMIRGRFGTDPMAGVVDEPVFIGRSAGIVTISDVMQTAQTIDSTDNILSQVGDYTGQALHLSGSKTFQYTCKEHGFIVGILLVRPQTGYMQGVERSWFRETYMDYAWKEFAHIGDQKIMNKEIYWDYSDNNPTLHDAAFGYAPRYAEYRWKNNTVSGKMRTQFLNWHLQEFYDTRPSLNASFLECTPRVDDVFVMADNSEHEMFIQCYWDNKAVRPISKFGTPFS